MKWRSVKWNERRENDNGMKNNENENNEEMTWRNEIVMKIMAWRIMM